MNQNTETNESEHHYLDSNLPLHHKQVEHATGVCAKTLKAAILHNPAQFGPGVAKVIQTSDKILLRFNPYRYMKYLEEAHAVQSGGVQNDSSAHADQDNEPDESADIDGVIPICTQAIAGFASNTINNSSKKQTQPKSRAQSQLWKKHQATSGAQLLRQLKNAKDKSR